MTPNTIIAAHGAIAELLPQRLPYKAARAIRKLYAALCEEVTIIGEQERMQVEEYGGKYEGNRITIEDAEKLSAFIKWRNDMFETEVELTLPECDLTAYVDSIEISPDALAALDGIVNFGEVDDV